MEVSATNPEEYLPAAGSDEGSQKGGSLMAGKTWRQKLVALFVILAGITILYGCKGSETRKAAEEIRDEVTGNRAVKQGEKAKKNIEEIEKVNSERMENFKKQAGDAE